MVLGYQLILGLEYGVNVPPLSMKASKAETIPNNIKRILSRLSLRLEKEYWHGLRISSEDELVNRFKLIDVRWGEFFLDNRGSYFRALVEKRERQFIIY